MEKMDPKVWAVWSCAFGMAAGAIGTYLVNRKKIDFANNNPIILEAQELMEESGKAAPDNAAPVDQINAYLSLYGDKYTFAEDADVESEDFVTKQVNTSPTALGCGFEIGFDAPDELYFTKVAEDMPAAKQGIERGDRIVSIGGEQVTSYASAKELMGKEGSTVTLTLFRSDELFDVELERSSDKAAAAGIETEKYGDTLYIRYESFGNGAGEMFRAALDSESFDSLIIDLRDNMGGQTSEAVTLADIFVPEGKTVYCHSDSGDISGFQTSTAPAYSVPIVLLVNENTASSAEIFSALLKQYSDTTLVGEKTFGKGIYQEYGVLHGCTVQYSMGYYTVGDWDSYHEKGIEPDVYVEMDPGLIGTELDVQLEKALEIIG